MKLRIRTPASKGSNQSSQGKAFLRPRPPSLCGIRFHGVISIGATTPIRLVETTRRLRHLQIPTTPATAPFEGRRRSMHTQRYAQFHFVHRSRFSAWQADTFTVSMEDRQDLRENLFFASV